VEITYRSTLPRFNADSTNVDLYIRALSLLQFSMQLISLRKKNADHKIVRSRAYNESYIYLFDHLKQVRLSLFYKYIMYE